MSGNPKRAEAVHGEGMHIGDPLRTVAGTVFGRPVFVGDGDSNGA